MSSSRQEEPENLLLRQIEAILFVASDGASVSEISLATGRPAASVRKALTQLSESYALSHGLEVVELGGKWFMTTADDLSETMDKFRAADESERVRLTRASLETLAVIAYSQPVTRSEIEAIRGVRCDRVIDTLLGYGLARIAGRRKSTGSPLLYRTTTKFLEFFDLPTIDELEELKRHRPETENPSAGLATVPETESEAAEDEAE